MGYFRGPHDHFFVAKPKKRVGNLREFLFHTSIDLLVSLDSAERLNPLLLLLHQNATFASL